MTRRQRRTHSATFKAQVAVEALRGDNIVGELVEKNAGSGKRDRFCSKMSVLTGLPMMP